MNYDTMSVHELVEMLVRFLKDAVHWTEEDQIPLIESALRKAVIREASVGKVHIISDGTGYFDIERDDDADVPDGFFDLIPKETP